MNKVIDAIPSLGKLIIRLMRDPRVPRRNKILFGAISAYLVLPWDFIPDWLPGVGQVDDILLIALALDSMINRIPEDVIREHWEGDEDVLDVVQSVLSTATTFVPDKLKSKLFVDTDQTEF